MKRSKWTLADAQPNIEGINHLPNLFCRHKTAVRKGKARTKAPTGTQFTSRVATRWPRYLTTPPLTPSTEGTTKLIKYAHPSGEQLLRTLAVMMKE